jgi:Yip1 domain
MNIVDRAKNILMTPKTEWPVISAEPPVIQEIMLNYVLPLTLVPAVAQVIGYGVVGGTIISFSLGAAIGMGIVTFLTALVGVFIAAYVVDFLAPNFGSEKNLGRAVQLVAYSSTPGWVAGILNIIPALSILVMLASLYGIYLLYLGMPFQMKTPKEKVVPYLVVAIIAVIVVYVILGLILSPIIMGIFGAHMLTGM